MSKKNRKIILLLFILLAVSLGFALLSTTLKINGTAGVKGNTWDIKWDSESIVVEEDSVEANTPTLSESDTKVSFEAELELPGDYYEFTIDAINSGTVDAMIDDIETTIKDNDPNSQTYGEEVSLPSYIHFTVTYADGFEIKKNQMLPKRIDENTPSRETYKVRLEFDKDSTVIPSSDLKYIIEYKVIYNQADSNAVPISGEANFTTDSWDSIITSYKRGRIEKLTTAMNNGTTRAIQLDLDNDGTPETTRHLRIANLSTPDECKTNGFSQTACGLVIEFADIITMHEFNQYFSSDEGNGHGNTGGWEYSEMRAFLNSTTYTAGNINYSSTGIYNALPVDLKSKIVDTTVVSGRGRYDNANHITADKLYLLDAREIYGESFSSEYNTASEYERQLDYYKSKGITMSNDTGAQKKKNDGSNYYWWLRSPSSDYAKYFYEVTNFGTCNYTQYGFPEGVSPAFRIASQED